MVSSIQAITGVDLQGDAAMALSGHGGARRGAGRKPKLDRKVKRSVTLSLAADAIVQRAMHADETYSQTLDRLLCATLQLVEPAAPIATDVTALVATLGSTREAVASIYRRLGWSRQIFEHLVQTYRIQLAKEGVRLHVATKDAASGRREQYITVDGMRYSALSRGVASGRTTSDPDVAG